MLSTVQIGITLVGIVAGAFGAARLAEPLAGARSPAGRRRWRGAPTRWWSSRSPTSRDHRRARAQAPGTARARAHRRSGGADGRPPVPRQRPAVWLLDRSGRLVLRLLGSEAQPSAMVTEEEVRTLIAEGTRTGVFHQQEQEMIGRVLRLADRPVRSAIMRRGSSWSGSTSRTTRRDRPHHPRAGTAASWSARAASTTCWARSIPAGCSGPRRPAARPAPGRRCWWCTTACRSCARWRRSVRRVSMALVVDEYGEVEGVVTVEDVLERWSATCPSAASARRRDRAAPGRLDADGRPVAIDEVKLTLGLVAAGGGGYHTLAGFILAQLGRVPEEGQSVVYDGWRFEVVDMDGRRIDKVLVRRSEARGPRPPGASAGGASSADDAGALGQGRRRDVGGRPQRPDDDDRDHHRPDDVPGPLVLKVHGWLPC